MTTEADETPVKGALIYQPQGAAGAVQVLYAEYPKKVRSFVGIRTLNRART